MSWIMTWPPCTCLFSSKAITDFLYWAILSKLSDTHFAKEKWVPSFVVMAIIPIKEPDKRTTS